MNKENVLTLKIIGNHDAGDFLPVNEITAAQKELIRFIAVAAVEEYRRNEKPLWPQPSNVDRMLRLPEVVMLTGRSRSSIYQDMKVGAFPKPLSLGARSVGWKESQITAWLEICRNSQFER